jgi:hypothetical protein
MKIGLKLATLASVLLLSAQAATAQTPTPMQEFNDERALSAARANIRGMEREELESFTDYLAACASALKQEIMIEYACTVARERFLIEFGSNRPVDRLVRIRTVIEKLVRGADRTGSSEHVTPDMVTRLVDVEFAFKGTATDRFAALRGAK